MRTNSNSVGKGTSTVGGRKKDIFVNQRCSAPDMTRRMDRRKVRKGTGIGSKTSSDSIFHGFVVRVESPARLSQRRRKEEGTVYFAIELHACLFVTIIT